MSTVKPFPLAVWQSGTNQNSIPANDNSLRLQALLAPSKGTADSAPVNPSDEDQWIVGVSWGGWPAGTIVVYRSGTWYGFEPPTGLRKYSGSSWVQWDGTMWASEAVQVDVWSAVKAMIVAGANVTVTANEADQTLTISATGTDSGGGTQTATWTVRDTIAGYIYNVVWASGLNLFVAVGSDIAATSPDGATWTIRTVPAGWWNDVCYQEYQGRLVAVCENSVMTSTDGINWTARTCPAGDWYAVACTKDSPGLFVALPYYDSSTIMTSPDGMNWTASAPGVTASWSDICWSQQRQMFIAVGDASAPCRIATSPNGTTWTQRTTSTGSYSMSCCADVGGTVLVGTNIGILVCPAASDPDTWQEATVPSVGRVEAIASTDNGIIALARDGALNGAAIPSKALLSISGTSWEQSGSDLTGSWGRAAASNGATAVAISYGIPAQVMTFGV